MTNGPTDDLVERTSLPRSVTVRSVAKDAGVSVATVSRVLSHTGKVSEKLRRRVLDSVNKLGYRPNLMAKSLATGQTKQLGLVIPDLRNPYINDVIRGIDQACSADGFMLLISDSQTDPEAELMLTDQLLLVADALILVAPRQDVDALNALGEQQKPVVSILGPPGGRLRNVAVDNYSGMLQIYDHLAELGHQRVAYLGGPAGSSQDKLRRDAISYAHDLGIEVIEIEAGADIEAGHRATDEALKHQPTAIAAYNDLLALGAFSRLGELGISLPDEMSLTGFDNITFTHFTYPRLTTVSTPRFELGMSAWNEVRLLMAGEPPGEPVMLPAEFIRGGTTAPPARRM